VLTNYSTAVCAYTSPCAQVRSGMVRSLVKSNAALDIRDEHGLTALELARLQPGADDVVVRRPCL
jgi:hypothetical protein